MYLVVHRRWRGKGWSINEGNVWLIGKRPRRGVCWVIVDQWVLIAKRIVAPLKVCCSILSVRVTHVTINYITTQIILNLLKSIKKKSFEVYHVSLSILKILSPKSYRKNFI